MGKIKIPTDKKRQVSNPHYPFFRLNEFEPESTPLPGDTETVIQTYYTGLTPLFRREELIPIKESFATVMARVLLDGITELHPTADNEGTLPDAFYKKCIRDERLEERRHASWDDEILTIFAKQMINILKKGQMVLVKNGEVDVSDDSVTGIYFRLIDAFWNRVDWKVIFPSDPGSADELWHCRYIIRDLLSRQSGRGNLVEITNEFFEITGFASSGDVFQISFIDFYLITWLRHFNVLSMNDDSGDDTVYLTCTDFGQRILKSL